jgi:hypothetical protein
VAGRWNGSDPETSAHEVETQRWDRELEADIRNSATTCRSSVLTGHMSLPTFGNARLPFPNESPHAPDPGARLTQHTPRVPEFSARIREFPPTFHFSEVVRRKSVLACRISVLASLLLAAPLMHSIARSPVSSNCIHANA